MTIRRKVKTIPLEEFIAAWVKGKSLREVQTLLDCDDTREAISSRAAYLRKNGVPLGRMTGRFLHGGPPDFEKLKKLHANLVAERGENNKVNREK
tara:strand:+ start:248 stop:532 length:285 start_codon:yes stop_codon:yes gene_type:complete